jgi:asparagine synthase (glutamine-hydrolysing)
MMPLVGYELMRLTRDNGVKVIMNGQGADESLAGYPSYFADYWSEMLGAGRVAQAWREIGEHAAIHGGSRPRSFLRQARRVAQSRLGRVPAYRRLALWSERRRRANDRWYSRQLTDHYGDSPKDASGGALDSALAYSIYRTPLPRILRVEDRNSMAHSLESRLPFLDHRLVSFAFSLPAEWRMRGPWNKFVLRESMRGRIPESVRVRVDKMGFPVPSGNWIAQALYEPVRDIVGSRQVRERGIYNVDAIRGDLDRHRRREVDVSWGLFNIAQFEAWTAL